MADCNRIEPCAEIVIGRVRHIIPFYGPKLIEQIGDQYQGERNRQLPFYVLLQQ
ncbi:hypothetical protein SDC9_182501 [bioreactor metagenome]|uniref:Uncharacterized protein n=1 Tax=bioreactor metagenome TaxID=1076179 RepID=A0A645H7K3_9ZZZZ